jgi:hypothetical protein
VQQTWCSSQVGQGTQQRTVRVGTQQQVSQQLPQELQQLLPQELQQLLQP